MHCPLGKFGTRTYAVFLVATVAVHISCVQTTSVPQQKEPLDSKDGSLSIGDVSFRQPLQGEVQDSNEERKETMLGLQRREQHLASLPVQAQKADTSRGTDKKTLTTNLLTLSRRAGQNLNIAGKDRKEMPGARLRAMTAELDRREALYFSIKSLRQHKKELDDELEQIQGQYDESIRQKEFAELRRQATHDAKDLESELRHESEVKLLNVRRDLPMFRKNMNDLQMQALINGNDIRSLLTQHKKLRKQKEHLVQALHLQGFGHWAESLLRQKANAYVSDALVKGSEYVVEPVVDSIEKAAKLEGELASRINRHVPIEASPFYAGLVSVIVTLFPIVVISSITMRIKRRLFQLTIRHVTLLGSIYFSVLASGCWIASMSGIDVIVTLQRRSQSLYDFSVMVQGLLYLIYCILHVAASISAGDGESFKHSSVVIVIGIHFFCHATAHLRRGEEPHVDRFAYFVYCLGFISTIRQSILSARSKKTGARPMKAPVKLGLSNDGSRAQEESREVLRESLV